MNHQETSAVLSILKAAYPMFYSKMNRRQMETVLNLWTIEFAEDEKESVLAAVLQLIQDHTGFPPDIAAVKGKLREMVRAANGEPTNEELWQRLAKAAQNGVYGAKEEYQKLPPILKKYLGSPDTLRTMAAMDEETFNTVSKGQFLKQVEILRKREETDQLMPPDVRAMLQQVYKPMDGRGSLTPEGENARRRELLAELSSSAQPQENKGT